MKPAWMLRRWPNSLSVRLSVRPCLLRRHAHETRQEVPLGLRRALRGGGEGGVTDVRAERTRGDLSAAAAAAVVGAKQLLQATHRLVTARSHCKRSARTTGDIRDPGGRSASLMNSASAGPKANAPAAAAAISACWRYKGA